MRISEFSVRYRVAVAMVYLSLLVLGLVAIRRIPLEFMPKMDMPFVNIVLNYPGASPVEICENIAEPIEEAISTMHGIEKIETSCRSGRAEVGIALGQGVKTDYQVLEIRERIEQIRPQLPSDLPPILVLKFSSEQWPVIFLSLLVPDSEKHYSDLFDQLIVRPLKTVEGVADIQFFGMEEKRVKIELDQDRLRAYRLSVLEVYQALISNNLNFSVGSLEHLGKKYSVRVIGEFKNLKEIRQLPIRSGITLGKIAKVDFEYVPPSFQGRVNGRPAYLMFIQKESNANTVEVCHRVIEKLDQLLKDPQLAGVKTKVWFNQGEEISSSIRTLTSTGIMGAIFAFLVLWLFLRDFRATMIVSVAIPGSLFITIFFMYLLDLSFNMITISGLVVAVGMLVDNSIVVLEAIYSQLQKGESPKTAAVFGADEVGLAISVSTTTTMIVFLPLVFSQHKEVSTMMGQLGIVMVLAIGTSLVVSLTLIPLLASLFLSRKYAREVAWFNRLQTGVLGLLVRSLKQRAVLLGSVALLFFLSLGVFFKKTEKESIPKAMSNRVRIKLNFEQKPEEKELEAKLKVFENLFLAHKEELMLDSVTTILTPRFVRMLLVMRDDRPSGFTVEKLQEKAKALVEKNINWPGVHISFEMMNMPEPGAGPSPTTIKVKGDNPEQVYYFAEEIRKKLKGLKTIKMVGELEKEGKREVHIEIDRERAQKYGFDPSQVAFTIAYLIRGVEVGKFTQESKQLNLYLQLEKADQRTLTQLKEMTIQNLEGKPVPLGNIARFRIKGIPEVVRRENRRFTVRIPVFPAVRDVSKVRAEVMRKLAGFHLPRGYRWVMGEEYQQLMNMLYDLLVSVLLAVALVFIVMTAQFESFLLPFVVMFTIPLGWIGVVFALTITGSTFNILSGAGTLLLIGIVVNNAIVLVDHIKNLRKKGFEERESLIQGVRDRFRPITMTAMTTIIGLTPMAFGFNDTGKMVYSPLAIAVMGGLVASTFLTPLVIPVIYSLTDSLREWRREILSYVRQNHKLPG